MQKYREPPMADKAFKLSYLHPKYILSWLLVLLSWILASFPRSWQIGLAGWLAKHWSKGANRRTRTIRQNIDLCFKGESQQYRNDLVKANLKSSLLMMFDLVNMIWRQPKALTEPVTVIGAEHLEKALQENKPLLLVTGHFTSFIQSLTKLASLTPYNAVYRRMDNPLLEAQFNQRAVSKHPMTLFHRKDIRNMLKKLADNGVVVIVPDQDFGISRGTFVNFFNIPTATITSLPQYAQQTDAQVLLFSSYRDETGECTVTFEPSLSNYPSGDDVVDTQCWSDWLERSIKQHPADYLWMHKRFKTRPEGEKSLYSKH